jgi:hypothetical protein
MTSTVTVQLAPLDNTSEPGNIELPLASNITLFLPGAAVTVVLGELVLMQSVLANVSAKSND